MDILKILEEEMRYRLKENSARNFTILSDSTYRQSPCLVCTVNDGSWNSRVCRFVFEPTQWYVLFEPDIRSMSLDRKYVKTIPRLAEPKTTTNIMERLIVDPYTFNVDELVDLMVGFLILGPEYAAEVLVVRDDA